MKAPKNIIINILQFLLVLLWTYASMVKLFDFETARNEMLNQVFPEGLANIFAWLVPLTEIFTAVLILFPGTAYSGYWISLLLLVSFTLYILFGLLHFYSRMPCSCGGIISQLSWGQHLLFNLFFITISLTAIIIYSKERKKRQK